MIAKCVPSQMLVLLVCICLARPFQILRNIRNSINTDLYARRHRRDANVRQTFHSAHFRTFPFKRGNSMRTHDGCAQGLKRRPHVSASVLICSYHLNLLEHLYIQMEGTTLHLN